MRVGRAPAASPVRPAAPWEYNPGMRLRQIALVAHELEPVIENLCAVLDLDVCYRDPGVAEFGLHNALMPIGTSFLEVVSPTREGTTAGRLLERRRGDGGYMVIVQTDDLAADEKRVAELGVRVVWRARLSDAATIHLHPRDVGAAIVSLDEMHPPDSWRWAGRDWRAHVRTSGARALVGAELQSDEPAALAARWGEVFARRPEPKRDGTHEIVLDSGTLRFVPARDGRGEGVGGIDVEVADARAILARAAARRLPVHGDTVEICGTRIRLVS
jgi:hypothetical protein